MMAGCVEGIRRALVLCLVLIAGTAIEQAPFVYHLSRSSANASFFIRRGALIISVFELDWNV